MSTKTLMGTDYLMRVDLTLDDWTWLCHMLNDTLKRLEAMEDYCCMEDLSEVLAVIEAGEAVAA